MNSAQEPGTDAEIAEFCKTNYDVDFPMFSKIVVKGEKIAPLYEFLTSPKTDPQHAGPITWNFEKFLVGRNGQVAARFAPEGRSGIAGRRQDDRRRVGQKIVSPRSRPATSHYGRMPNAKDHPACRVVLFLSG